jgi:hypothetical protein
MTENNIVNFSGRNALLESIQKNFRKGLPWRIDKCGFVPLNKIRIGGCAAL